MARQRFVRPWKIAVVLATLVTQVAVVASGLLAAPQWASAQGQPGDAAAPPATDPAPAVDPAKAAEEAKRAEAEQSSDLGKQAYRDKQYEEAYKHFDKAYSIFAEPKYLYNMARCQEKLSKYTEAVALLERYITTYKTANAGAEPPDVKDVRNLIRELKQRAFEALPEVSIQSVPPGALVQEDGLTIGSTPLVTHMKPGPHKIVLKLPTYSDLDAEVVVPDSGKVSVVLSLKSNVKHAGVEVWCNIRGAQIILDGKVVGQTPYASFFDVEPGRHQLALSRGSYTSFEQVVDVPEDKILKVSAFLQYEGSTTTFRTYLGWPALIIGGLAAGGGAGASYFADQQYRGTPRFKTFEGYQNLGYGTGIGLGVVGLTLLIWDAARDGTPPDDLTAGPQPAAGLVLQPYDTSKKRP